MAFIAIIIVDLVCYAPQPGNSLQSTFISKSIAKSYSLLLNEKQEKENEGDEDKIVSDFILFTDVHVSEGILSKEYLELDFDVQPDATEIYLQHCCLLI